MDVSSIIAEPSVFAGREVTVDGFVVVGRDSRLVADWERPDGLAILLPHAAIRRRLLECVPVYGGGPHIYNDDASVTGIVHEGPLRFVSVRRLVVRREAGEVYELDDIA